MGPRFIILSIVNRLKEASFRDPEPGELSQDGLSAGASTSSQRQETENHQQESAPITKQVKNIIPLNTLKNNNC